MKITRQNIKEEYPKINQSLLPEALKEKEFIDFLEALKSYGQDKDLDEWVDLFISNINKVDIKTTEPASEAKTKKKEQSKKAPKPKPEKKAKVKKESKPSAEKKQVSKKPEATSVSSIDLQISLIKSFLNLQKKSASKKSILNLYKKIEKLATEEKIRRTSKYANEIIYISERLKEAFNKSTGNLSSNATINCSVEKIEELNKLGNSQKVRLSVYYIKRFINLLGKENAENTKKLLSQINNAIAKNEIAKNDIYYDKIKIVILKLTKFFKSGEKQIEISQTEMNGLRGFFKKKPLKKKQIIQKKGQKTLKNNYRKRQNTTSLKGLQDNSLVNSTDLIKMDFDVLKFSGKWFDLIGNPTKPFQIMIYGSAGSMKSTLAVQFAHYLASNHNLKVLFLAKEEGISNTTKDKFLRLKADHKNIYISEKIPQNLNNFDVLIIDSVNEMNFTPDDIRNLLLKNPNLSTFQIFKATKEGRFLGMSDFAHLCQAELICDDGFCQSQKNRFGGNKKVKILN